MTDKICYDIFDYEEIKKEIKTYEEVKRRKREDREQNKE